MPTTYLEIKNYWSKYLCNGGNLKFPFNHFRGKKVLEIGCGSGIDAFKFVINNAIYTGIDLTDIAVETTNKKIGRIGKALKMNAEYLDFPDNYFDLVYSFGVIHHALNPQLIIKEINRVLKPNGCVFLMLYNKFSLRYLIEINILRRILWWLHYPKYKQIRGLIPCPTQAQWVSINTDNLGCPLSRVYTKNSAKRLLHKFIITNTWTENWGWFRMVIARKLLIC